LFGSWVKNCIYCGAKIVDDRILEITAGNTRAGAQPLMEPAPDASSIPEANAPIKPRFHKVELESVEREPPSFPSPEEAPTAESSYALSEAEFAAQRIITATTEYDEEEVKRKEEEEKIAREKERIKAELLNPAWLQKRLVVPFYIFLVCLYLLLSPEGTSLIGELGDKIGISLFLVTDAVAVISLLSCFILIYIDIQRRNRARKL